MADYTIYASKGDHISEELHVNCYKASLRAKSLVESGYDKAWVDNEDDETLYQAWSSKGKIRTKTTPKAKPKVLPESEVLKLINACDESTFKGFRDKIGLLVMWRGGLRVSELRDLRVTDIEFETIHDGDDEIKVATIRVEHGKGGLERFVHVDKELTEWLQKWIAFRPKNSPWLVMRSKKRPSQMTTRRWEKLLERLSEATGVWLRDGDIKKHAKPHTLRHSFATDLLREGDFNIVEIQKMLGHKNVTTTQVYTHIVDSELTMKMGQRRRVMGCTSSQG